MHRLRWLTLALALVVFVPACAGGGSSTKYNHQDKPKEVPSEKNAEKK
jgi:hypothetical protein